MTSPLLICFAGDRWDGNPHSRHHLMRRFAGDFEVLFIESVPMRSMAGTSGQELRRVWLKLRNGVRLRTVAPHLHVLAPLPVPPSGRLGRAGQLASIRAGIAYARRRLALDGPAISWFSVPIAAPLRGHLGENGSLFYYQDRYDEFSHVDASRLRDLIASLATGCDVSIATSDALADDLRRHGADPVVVPHGVDVERFAADEPPPPLDLGHLERPLVGYVGIIDDYLSFEAIRAVAERLRRGTVVLVGMSNTDVSALAHPRVKLLGFRPYAAIPGYLAAFDCCMLPFRLNRLTVAVDPIKLREYLAAGRPVVSASLPAVKRFADVIEFADEPGAFADAVMRSLEPGRDSQAERAARRGQVAGESWDTAADQIRPMLVELATRRQIPDPAS
jgi:glycosyltransferase involved in cell wall biosynthesis